MFLLFIEKSGPYDHDLTIEYDFHDTYDSIEKAVAEFDRLASIYGSDWKVCTGAAIARLDKNGWKVIMRTTGFPPVEQRCSDYPGWICKWH
jgi:hypothetical protein